MPICIHPGYLWWYSARSAVLFMLELSRLQLLSLLFLHPSLYCAGSNTNSAAAQPNPTASSIVLPLKGTLSINRTSTPQGGQTSRPFFYLIIAALTLSGPCVGQVDLFTKCRTQSSDMMMQRERLERQWTQSAAAVLLELPKGQRIYSAALFDRCSMLMKQLWSIMSFLNQA